MGHVGPRFITGGEMSTQGGGHCLRVNRAWDQGLQKQVGPQGLSGLCGLTKVSVSKEAWGGRKCHPGLNPAPSKACYCVWWERDRCTTGPATRLKCQQSCGSSCIQPTLLRDHCGQWKGREDFPRARGWGKSHPSCWWEGSRCADLSERCFAWNNGLGWESCAGGRIAAVPSRAYSLGSRWLCIQLRGVQPHSCLYRRTPQHLPPMGGHSLIGGRPKKGPVTGHEVVGALKALRGPVQIRALEIHTFPSSSWKQTFCLLVSSRAHPGNIISF